MLFLATSTEKGLLQELWEYFIDKYFSVEMPYLENFTVTSNSLISIRLIIIGLTFGLIAAAIMTVYNKRYLGDFIRLLISEECFDSSSAKTLSELGYLKNPVIRGVIKSGGSLSRWARCAEEDEFLAEVDKKRKEFEEAHKDEKHPPKFKAPEFRRDCNTMHFYLPGEKKYAAEIKFESKGAHWGMVIIVAIIALIICAFLCYMLPDVLKMVDNFITMAKGSQ